MKIAAISIADYCEATEGMPHDVERLYFRLLLKMYSREGGLPNCDKDLARMFGYDVRSFCTLKAKLLAWPDAIFVDGDLLKNSRLETELERARERRAEAVENGKKGGRPPKIDPDLRPKSGRSSTEVGTKLGGSPVASDMQQVEKSTTYKNPSPSPSPIERETVGARDELKVAFNGSTAAMVADVQAWMPCDEPIARKWLQSTLTACGQEATAQAYQILIAKQAQGEVVPNPIPFWGKTAASLKRKPTASAARPPAKSFAEQARERNIRAQAKWVR